MDELIIKRMMELGGKLEIERESQKRISYTYKGVRVYWNDYERGIFICNDDEGYQGKVSEVQLHEVIEIVRAISKLF